MQLEKKRLARVTNNLETFLSLPDIPVDAGPDGKRPPGVKQKGVRLGPGFSNVDDDYMGQILALPKKSGPGRIIHSLIADGKLHVLRATDPRAAQETRKPEGPVPPETLRNVNDAAALAYIKVESSEEVLRKWMKNERRHTIREAIETKLASRVVSVSLDDEEPSEEEDEFEEEEN